MDTGESAKTEPNPRRSLFYLKQVARASQHGRGRCSCCVKTGPSAAQQQALQSGGTSCRARVCLNCASGLAVSIRPTRERVHRLPRPSVWCRLLPASGTCRCQAMALPDHGEHHWNTYHLPVCVIPFFRMYMPLPATGLLPWNFPRYTLPSYVVFIWPDEHSVGRPSLLT